MKVFPLFVISFCLLFAYTCKDKSVSNEEAERETAKVFFGDGSYMDLEEISGDVENRVTCKRVTTGQGVFVNVRDYDGRIFQLEIDNVVTTGFQIITAYARFIDANGEIYETALSGLPDTEVYWRDNLQICEFTFGSQTLTQLFSPTATVILDSLNIRALREDD